MKNKRVKLSEDAIGKQRTYINFDYVVKTVVDDEIMTISYHLINGTVETAQFNTLREYETVAKEVEKELTST